MRATGRARRGTRAPTACRWSQRVVPGHAGHRGQRVRPRLSGRERGGPPRCVRPARRAAFAAAPAEPHLGSPRYSCGAVTLVMNAVGWVAQETVTRRVHTRFTTEPRREIPGEAMPVKPLEPGDPERLGRFELLGRLGEGGQGIVYLGRGTGPGEERVAVKVLRSSVDAMVLERLARELDAVHQVQPFVTAGVIEASAEGDRRYIVSEFVDGPSLQDRVRDRGPLPEHDLQRLAVGTVTALTAIHGAGVVHRDFKPANVLLGPDGPRGVDFGIARLIDASTITSGLLGTPSFIAPEQLAGSRPTSAVDIFAWAVTMIFAATGRLAFGGDSVMAVMMRIINEVPDVTGVPDSLRPVIVECLDKDPARRPKARDIMLRLV